MGNTPRYEKVNKELSFTERKHLEDKTLMLCVLPWGKMHMLAPYLTRRLATAALIGGLALAVMGQPAQAETAAPRAAPSDMQITRLVNDTLRALETAVAPATVVMPDAGLDSARATRQTRPPLGYVLFCQAMPHRCVAPGDETVAPVALTEDRLRELDRVNRHVNEAVVPVTDERLYKRRELWSFPRRTKLRLAGGETVHAPAGDCEDYVLLKRDILIRRGWPASALLITVVRDLDGLGHAVLTVRTTQGDLVLDNQAEDIAHWRATGYGFIKRQSVEDPSVWVRLDDAPNRATAATAATN